MEEKRKRKDKGKKKEFVDKKGNGRQKSEMGRKKEWFRNKDFGRSFSNWAWEGWSLEQYTPLLLLTCASFPSSPPRNESCTPRSLGHRKTRNIYFDRCEIIFGGKSIKHIPSCCKWQIVNSNGSETLDRTKMRVRTLILPIIRVPSLWVKWRYVP